MFVKFVSLSLAAEFLEGGENHDFIHLSASLDTSQLGFQKFLQCSFGAQLMTDHTHSDKLVEQLAKALTADTNATSRSYPQMAVLFNLTWTTVYSAEALDKVSTSEHGGTLPTSYSTSGLASEFRRRMSSGCILPGTQRPVFPGFFRFEL
ncbi:hypothetical protein BDN71DRAFT_982616 [Pleurotus eryngii]|uniref:Uncharacterized protein n=1 Tax=Pleurotus eryngii TaxID=5323 RepID=A0A9P5ZV10_PLEER|nr:hypothetical protein BDN71DRAFT_982616 [Pleurotus eryngii]